LSATLARATITRTKNKRGSLTKEFELGEGGALITHAAPELYDGEFCTLSVDPHGLIELLPTLETNEALCHGVEKRGRPFGRITTQKALAASPSDDTIARTKEHLVWPDGPGVWMIDLDLKDALEYLPQLRDHLTIDGLRQVLIAAMPQLADVPMIGWFSASANLYRTDTKAQIHGVTGARFYVYVEHAAEIPQLAALLHSKLLLEGYGYAFVSKAGTIKIRSIIDQSVSSPERLDFAAGAKCGAGLFQDRGAPQGWKLDSTTLAALRSVPGLSAAGESRVAGLESALITLALPRAEKARTQYAAARKAKGLNTLVTWKPDGTPEALKGEHSILLDDGTVVTVDAILENPNAYNGRSCADPHESDYAEDRRIARIYTMGQKSGPAINSFAHGGAVYMLRKSGQEEFRDYISDEDARETPPSTIVKDDHLTDMGNAGRFAHESAGRLMYANDRWHGWQGTHWAASHDVDMQEQAKHVVRRQYADACAIPGEDERKRRLAWAFRSEAMPRLRAMVDLARGGLAINGELLDANPWLLNVRNGTLDLRTGELHPHSPSDYITKVAPVAYDRNATCPLWLAFLVRIMGGDQELVSALQRMVGYSLTGLTTEQVLFLLYGLGANGKSTMLEVLREMFGDYAAQTNFSTLLQRKHDGGARPDIVKLRGARMVTASEVPPGKQFDSMIVKAFTGGDTISERELYRAPVEFRFEAKPWLAANHRPKIDGGDSAMWRRVRLIPFSVTIPEEERDPDLLEKLRAELPGILRWAVEGCLQWQADGLNMPSAVVDATAGYRAEMSELAEFIQARCRLARGARTTKEEFYDAFVIWCNETQRIAADPRAFNKQVATYDPSRITSGKSSVMCWQGIALRQADDCNEGVALEEAP